MRLGAETIWKRGRFCAPGSACGGEAHGLYPSCQDLNFLVWKIGIVPALTPGGYSEGSATRFA